MTDQGTSARRRRRVHRHPVADSSAMPAARRRSRGQVIVIFAGAMLAFMGLMAIVIDVSWYWANTLRVQRAADAA
ncbi:MAG TPA: pilus assembly protein TadG-related protein, partial [Candidatus Limnocylindrales bacterium]